MRVRRRAKAPDEPQSRERWLISYADFITLLFAFFVVMYSVSSVNEGKYKVLSETLEGVFNAPARTLNPIPLGDHRPGDSSADSNPAQELAPVTVRPTDPAGMERRRTEALKSIADEFAGKFNVLMSQGLVTVDRTDEWIALTLRDSLLFSSGEAEPHYDAFAVIESIAAILSEHDNAVVVEGFTDNVPIRTAGFASNWELSAARAAALVRLLAAEGIKPERLAAVGYGEFQPVARNDTADGRKRNRRVVLLVSRDNAVRGVVR